LLLRQLMAFSKRMGEMLQRDGAIGFRAGRFFDSHLFASPKARNAPIAMALGDSRSEAK
jgi:hypothetical protein